MGLDVPASEIVKPGGLTTPVATPLGFVSNVAGGGAPAADPPVTSGLVFYFDADRPGADYSNGDDVAPWPDQSGNGNDATKDSFYDPARYRASLSGLDGKPGIDFRSDWSLNLPTLGISGSQNRTLIYAGCLMDPLKNPYLLQLNEGTTTDGALWRPYISSATPSLVLYGGGSYGFFNLDPAPSAHIGCFRLKGTTIGDHICRINQAQEAATGTETVDTVDQNHELGHRGDLGPVYGKCLLYNRALTISEIESVENWLNDHYAMY